jgi:hypothetical protein
VRKTFLPHERKNTCQHPTLGCRDERAGVFYNTANSRGDVRDVRTRGVRQALNQNNSPEKQPTIQ